jgi:phospholipid-binding lipoprotein MlaA
MFFERRSFIKWSKLLLVIFTLLFITGCASTGAGSSAYKDPFEKANRSMLKFNLDSDQYLLKPLARGYEKIMPGPIRIGVTNFFSNLWEPMTIVNDLLQGKIVHAGKDTTRFVINSTLGLLGLFDVASKMNLPKRREDFGQTLGYWGVNSGPYLVLPFFGPSSVRDGIGLVADSTIEYELYYDNMSLAHNRGMYSLKIIDARADLLSATNIIDETAPDPYSFIRDAWTQRRQNLVYDGNPPDEFSEDDLFEDDLFTDDIKR